MGKAVAVGMVEKRGVVGQLFPSTLQIRDDRDLSPMLFKAMPMIEPFDTYAVHSIGRHRTSSSSPTNKCKNDNKRK
jgi:hypothetical protein